MVPLQKENRISNSWGWKRCHFHFFSPLIPLWKMFYSTLNWYVWPLWLYSNHETYRTRLHHLPMRHSSSHRALPSHKRSIHSPHFFAWFASAFSRGYLLVKHSCSCSKRSFPLCWHHPKEPAISVSFPFFLKTQKLQKPGYNLYLNVLVGCKN